MQINNQIIKLYAKALHGLMLLKNKRIGKHVVVFESDDWGSIRMPSLDVLEKLQRQGIKLALPQSYDSVDTLASNDDLELLMEVLASVKDSKGNPAKMTLNTCVANPDFDKIKASNFQEYFYEPFTETLKRYQHHDRAFELWKEGMAHDVFQPQFHGREHLNPQKWLRYMRNGNNDVFVSFDEQCYSLVICDKGRKVAFLEAYKIDKIEEIAFVKTTIKEGLDLFEKLFGFRSESMIAPCYTWDDYVEEVAGSLGVKYLQGGYIQSHSPWQRSLGNYITGHFSGEVNQRGQCYTIRNCSFEPSQVSTDNADSCMASIKKAMDSHLPAVVSCHRLNFIGELNTTNRDGNLREFRKLLKLIVEKYPDVEFMSSDELGKLLLQSQK